MVGAVAHLDFLDAAGSALKNDLEAEGRIRIEVLQPGERPALLDSQGGFVCVSEVLVLRTAQLDDVHDRATLPQRSQFPDSWPRDALSRVYFDVDEQRANRPETEKSF